MTTLEIIFLIIVIILLAVIGGFVGLTIYFAKFAVGVIKAASRR